MIGEESDENIVRATRVTMQPVGTQKETKRRRKKERKKYIFPHTRTHVHTEMRNNLKVSTIEA